MRVPKRMFPSGHAHGDVSASTHVRRTVEFHVGGQTRTCFAGGTRAVNIVVRTRCIEDSGKDGKCAETSPVGNAATAAAVCTMNPTNSRDIIM